ncbi:hypothetical protein CRX69_06580 [Pseudomonas rhizophila]|uniref:Uncharacterized protein n=1 Tax=Pseudomonas rhizophila TaxID=2045200 RepID=A0ABM6UBU3_9PSED|nr:hypothetical protein CRX69_06580 [Pseudomonas rhizophila]
MWERALWEQSLLAMNDDTVLQLNRVAFIASKLGSHRSWLPHQVPGESEFPGICPESRYP